MAIIKKFSPKENLNTFSTFISDTNPNSTYFRITEFKDTFSGGKNGFLIEGSEHLKETTEIKIEILDVEGNPIYFEPGDGIPEYYEGISKVIAVYVYNDTPIGQANITVLGELKTYLEGGVVRDIPDEWKGVYNVKWQKSFKVNKLLPNEDKVRFYRRPIVNIEEIVKPIFSTDIPTVTQSGSVRGIPNIPLENQSLTNFTQPTSYRLEIIGDGEWTGSIVGNVIEVDTLGYFPTVTEIVNSKNIIVNPPYTINGIVKSFANQPYTSSFEYIEGITNNDSPLTGSFAKINITELKTFVGDVARVKVFRKSKSNVGDYEFVQEIQLESNEILVDLGVAGKNEEPYGLFTDSNIYTYWVTSSNDITVDFNQSYLYNSAKIDSNSGTQYFYTSASLPIQKGIEYTLSFGLRSGVETTTNYIQAFISGSRQSTVNGNPTTIQIRENVVKINSSKFALQKQIITENFIADDIDDARLYFEVVGTDWYINDVSLKASQETSFSPDEITFIQSVPKTLQAETFDYRFEFYDINNNYIPVNVFKTQRFVGGNTALLNRSLDLDPTNSFFSFDSASNPVGVTVINFDIVRNLLTGSVTFTSGAYDSNGDLIPSVGYVGQYPGLLTNVSDTSATLTAANFTGSDSSYTVQYIEYTAFCEDIQTKETISRVSAGANGESGVNYVIKSFNGNLIRNYEPDKKIELQAYRIDGSQINQIGSGDFKLAVVSESLYIPISVASSSGFLPDVEVGDSGSLLIDYNAKFGRESISGSLDVFLVSGSTIFDSITIADVLDGNTIGVVEPSTYVFVKNPNDTFTPLSSSITATFFDRRDTSAPITASLIVYPSHSFLPPNDDNDINHLYYETGAIDSRINLLVRDSDGSFFNSGKENARETELVNLDFSFVDSTGQTIRAFETIHIATSGDFGKSSIFVDVTPSNFVFIADETGTILNYDDLETLIQVYYGTQLLSPDISAGVPGTFTASFSTTNISISNITSDTTGITIGQFSNMVGNNASVEYDLIVTPPPTSIYKTESFNVSFTQNFSVVRGGSNSRSVNLSADTYIVIYDGEDNIIYPPSETITLQAQALNHTGSVYYQFLKNNVTQSAPSLQTIYDLSSLDIVESGETDIWSVRTRESETGPIVAVDSISIAGIKNGKDSRSVVLVASSNFVNYDGTGSESPIGQEILLTATPINHFGSVLYEFKSGSTTIQSGSTPTYVISSSYTQSAEPNVPVKPLFNESHVYSVFTREGTLASPILSADAITISGIKAGTDSENYAIVALNGTAIRNSNPNTILEVKATYQGQNLSSGPYKLAILSGSLYEPLSAASASGFIIGVQSGSLNTGIDYNATFNSQSISGSLEVFIVSGSSANGIEDSTSLVDISDGLGGGFVEATSLVFVRDANNVYTPLTSSVTASFYQRGTFENPLTASLIVHPIFDGTDKMKYVTASVSPLIQIQVDNQDGGLVESNVESTTKDLNFVFLFTDPNTNQTTSVTETFFIVSDGLDGLDGLQVYVINQIEEVQSNSAGTPNQGTGPYTNTGTDIYVYEGTSSLQYTTSTPSNGEWTVVSTNVVPNNITVGSITDGGNYAIVGNHSNLSAESVNINYNISGKRITGQSFALTGSQVVYKVLAGANGTNGTSGTNGTNGTDGADAYTINLSNEAVTLPTTIAGTVSFGGSGTAISVFRGTTELNSVNTAPPRDINEFSASIFSISPHITPGTVDISGNPVIFGDITNWFSSTTSSGSIVYKIDISNPIVTVYKTQSFALSYEGETGPGIVFRGFWTGSINYQYDVASRRRDAVLYDTGSAGNGVLTYYATLQQSGPPSTVVTPTGSLSFNSGQYWEELGTEDFFVAAKIAIFEESFVKNTINVGNNPGNDKANIIIQGSGSFPYIAIGQTGSVIGYEQPGIFMGVSVNNDVDIQRFSIVNDENTNYLKWDGENLKIKGNIEFGSSAPGQNILQLDWKYKERPINSSAYDNILEIKGEVGENAISYSLDPFGNRSLTWDCYSEDAAGDNQDGGFETKLFPIDSGSSYKYVVYVKPTNTSGNPLFLARGYSTSSIDIGLISGSVIANGQSANFGLFRSFGGVSSTETGSWHALIGYVFAENTPEATLNQPIGSQYNVETNTLVRGLNNFKWKPNTGFSAMAISHYSDDVESGVQMQIWGPAVYKIDGTEPSDAALIDKAKALADGKYSGGTFISADTIFSPTIAGIDGRFSGSVVVGYDGEGITLDGVDKKIYIGQGQYANSNTPFYAASGSSDIFSLGDKLRFNGSDLTLSGSIVATSGRISGSVVVGQTGNGITLDGFGNRIYIGNGGFNDAGTPFYVASGSDQIFSLGDKLTFTSNGLNISGSVTADSGKIGGFDIESGQLASSGSKILLDGNDNSIEVFDSNNTKKIVLNTDTFLPNPNVADSGNLIITSSTHQYDWDTGDGAGGDGSIFPTTASLGIFTPTSDASYTITWPFTRTDNVRVEACGYGAYAQLGLSLRVEKSTGEVVVESSRHSTNVEASINNGYSFACIDEATFQFYYAPSEPKVSCLSSRTFSITTPLEASQTYCVKVMKDASVRNDDIYIQPDDSISQYTSCAILDIFSPNASYSGTPSFTIINGAGFQSVVDCGKFLRVTGSSNPTTEIAGGLKVDGVYQNIGCFGVGIDNITFTGISDTTPSFSLTKSFINFQMGVVPSTYRAINSTLSRKASGVYCIEFTCPMSSVNYGVLGTATVSTGNTIVSVCKQGTGYYELRITDHANNVVDVGCITAMVLG
jgi:hypothetical protein